MAIDLAKVTGADKAAEAKAAKESAPKIANGMDKDAFMKLFLEQLKNQDPTAPMETDKIITQTAQLTQVEMQEENKKAMKEMVNSMKVMQESNEEFKAFQETLKETMDKLSSGIDSSVEASGQMSQASSFQSVAMVGKIAETDVSGVNYAGEGKTSFALYFDEKIKADSGTPVIQIFDEDKRLVRTISLKDRNGEGGYLDFSWDGLDDRGEQMPQGSYSIQAEYNLNPKTNQYLNTRVGRGEIQSVLFDKGKPLIRMGELILPLSAAMEFYDKHVE
ncbi:flagellar basal body rod modification protein [Helicobacter sp. CLO-3]|nr:flagellar basal body rod modification protein [Helicobacter sp. CLO-3]OHU81674.1 flagellar basal body rod modification protein [Helicobacter sp. CLO-3]